MTIIRCKKKQEKGMSRTDKIRLVTEDFQIYSKEQLLNTTYKSSHKKAFLAAEFRASMVRQLVKQYQQHLKLAVCSEFCHMFYETLPGS